MLEIPSGTEMVTDWALVISTFHFRQGDFATFIVIVYDVAASNACQHRRPRNGLISIATSLAV